MEGEETRDIDYAAAALQRQIRGLAEHVRPDVAAQREDGRQVYLQHGVPIAVRELVCGVALLDAAAVEQDVDSVSVGQDLGRELCYALV